MARYENNQLSKLSRVELLELLVEQGEQLERTQEALAVMESRAAHQERIARLAEDAAARLSGILEAAQLAQTQYAQNLRDLKASMGVATESISDDSGDATQAYTGYSTTQTNTGYAYPATSAYGTTGYTYPANSYQGTYPATGYSYTNGYNTSGYASSGTAGYYNAYSSGTGGSQ